VPADVATPLAVAVAELLQNAVEHAFLEFDDSDATRPDHSEPGAVHREPGSGGHIDVRLEADEHHLVVEVIDDGSGLPEDFDLDVTSSLGLSIVRDLVRTQLGGTIVMQNRCGLDAGTGTSVAIELPVPDAQRSGL
jgi:two-component sensor histidine kinase